MGDDKAGRPSLCHRRGALTSSLPRRTATSQPLGSLMVTADRCASPRSMFRPAPARRCSAFSV
eukprot:6835634-Alexandrium_andersonii.AAC.1